MAPISILLLNPNSSTSMTNGMLEAISAMDDPDHPRHSITPYTAPSASPASINDAADLSSSHDAVLADPSLANAADSRDGILVACYSEHALVSALTARHTSVAITGIFEASVLTALGLGGRWGIVTTGVFWEDHLTDAVGRYLIGSTQERATTPAQSDKFAGVFSTGLNAGDFHSDEVTEEVVREKLRDATRRLLKTQDGGERVRTVVLGCAGMAGLGEIVREEARATYGEEEGENVYVVDPVRAGVVMLEAINKNRNMFRGA